MEDWMSCVLKDMKGSDSDQIWGTIAACFRTEFEKSWQISQDICPPGEGSNSKPD